MKTWREVLGVPSDTKPVVPDPDERRDKRGNLRVLSPLSPLREDLKKEETTGFVTNVTASEEIEATRLQHAQAIANDWLKTLGGGKARIVPFGAEQERGKSWDAWMAEQCNRIFAEGSTTRSPSKESVKVTAFQRASFAQLAGIEASSEAKLVELAKRRGQPRECAKAFWRFRSAPRTD